MKKKQSLNGAWKLYRWKDRKDCGTVSVPGSVLSGLLEKKMIEDPYWRQNEYAVRELLAEDYLFEREFELENLDAEEICLVCLGVDTLAEIRLNGQVIGKTSDMHRTWRFRVKEFLRPGTNRITVHFSSALLAARKEDAQNDIFYTSTGCIPGNGAIRKAHYMFGWDWGPQLPDMGIFREVFLEYQKGPQFTDVYLRQKHVHQENKVILDICCMLNKGEYHQEKGQYLAIEVISPDGSSHQRRYEYQSQILWEILNPILWWPNGLGGQPLYQVTVRLEDEEQNKLDEHRFRIGLREITVSREKHSAGEEFAFVVNGIKIFAMGANYIPEDNFLDRIAEGRTRKLIEDCKAANFNCIRVWGGGFYPNDFFYDACDEAGILVWQDLMFACNVYALTDSFESDIVEETKDNVRRIRHHACLALWCGNNEMEWGWGDEWARIRGHHPRYKADYTKIFEYILPKALRETDKDTFFWPSSPSSGGSYDEPNAVNRGDQHYWEVWHSGKPFTEYRKNYFSFCSEYGFQSFPSMKTVKAFTVPEDRNIFSSVMESHQKNGTANGKILNYVADYFLYPSDLPSLIYISQILQLKAIQYGVEHWRRNRGRCMGSLYWQLNDCWPVASWSSIDYYGRWKALHYGAARFYAPVMLSACEKEELSMEIGYYVHNDSREAICGKVEAALIDRKFHVLWQQKKEISLGAMSVAKAFEVNFESVLPTGKERNQVFARGRLIINGKCISEEVTLFAKPKHFAYEKPEYHIQVLEMEDVFAIQVKSSTFAQYAALEAREYDWIFSDNYFDLTSPEGKSVWLKKGEQTIGLCADDVARQLTVMSVADSYVLGP